jgi:hypothetical protein
MEVIVDNEAQTELLIKLDTKLDNLVKAFDKVSNGVGFPRCIERGTQIKTLRENYRWLRNTFFGGATIMLISTVSVAVYAYVTKIPS